MIYGYVQDMVDEILMMKGMEAIDVLVCIDTGDDGAKSDQYSPLLCVVVA